MPKNIIICDDHILFLSGITELLIKLGNDYTVTAFSNSNDCKNHIINNGADVFICDLNIDKIDGFILIDELRHQLRNTKIIILTAYFEEFLIQKAEKMGIGAFLKKETTAEELIDVIEAPINAPFYSNTNSKKPTNQFAVKDESVVNKLRLSRQEKEIIKLIIEGKTSKEIADNLFISKTTVDTHRRNINKKLEITNSSSLIKFAHENNLFS